MREIGESEEPHAQQMWSRLARDELWESGSALDALAPPRAVPTGNPALPEIIRVFVAKHSWTASAPPGQIRFIRFLNPLVV